MLSNSKVNMILSLLIAIALWAYVASSVDMVQKRTVRGIPVQYVHQEALQERGLAIAGDETNTVDITIEGNSQAVSGIEAGDFTATADVSECVEGDNVLEVAIKTSKDVSRTSDATLTVHVTAEKIVSVSKNVKPELTGNKDTQAEPEFSLLSDERITVSGARSKVEKVAYVRAPIRNLSEYGDGDIAEVKLVPVDETGNRVSDVQLSAEKARVRITFMDTRKVKLLVDVKGKPKDGYQYDGLEVPETIVLKGRQGQLEEITSVSAKAIDISGMEQTAKVELKFSLPAGIEISSKSLPVIATISISQMAAEEKTIFIEPEAVSLNRLSEGKQAEILSGSMKFSVMSAREPAAGDFKLSADLSGLEDGEHDVPLVVEYSGDGNIQSAPDTITVKISDE